MVPLVGVSSGMVETVFGKYRLIAELAQGGMADVFLAVSTGPAGLGFSKLVVIKRLRQHLAKDPEFMAMLVDEARIAARLNHPNVIQTLEIGEAEGGYFLAMEYLDGQPLHRIRNRAKDRGLSLNQVYYNALVDVLAGLHHAHELADYDGSPLRVVHRDVTPHNVFVTYNGQVKVVDFGIAKAVGRDTETRYGIIKGKAPYMAPEQAMAMPVNRRADIFSVGVMLWEAAVGERLWRGSKDDAAVVRRLIHGEYESSPRAAGVDVPDAIDRICRRALAHLPDNRYATAAEFEADLAAYLEKSRSRLTDRETGAFVSDLFRENRAETKAIIETQLSGLSANPALRMVQLAPDSGSLQSAGSLSGPSSGSLSGKSSSISFGSLPSSERQFEETAATVANEDLAQAVDRRSSLRRIPGFVGIGLAALGVAIWSFARVFRTSRVASAPPPAPSEIVLMLRATPAETKFSIDNGPLVGSPYVVTQPKDNRTHNIRAQAPGYGALTENVVFSEDVSLRVVLTAEKDAGGATTVTPPPKTLPKRPR
jgi:serine/threonine protein kinase